MKHIMIVLFFLGLCAPLYSMELVPLCEQNKKIKVVKIGAPIIKREKDWLEKEELRRKMAQCVDKGPAMRRGAGWGGCCGCTLGGNGAGAYYFVDGCIGCCCSKTFSVVSTGLMNKIMCYALLIGGCGGCTAGVCCVATGLSKNIDHYFA